MRILKAWSVVLLSAMIFTACNEDEETPINPQNEYAEGSGKANVYITDAPIDNANVSAVVVSISALEAKGPSGWTTLEEFNEPVVIDLLSYQNGDSYLLTDNDLKAGTYSEVRLKLNVAADGAADSESFIKYTDGSKKPLFAANSTQEYTASGNFTISEGVTTGITLDFDVRKAVVESAEGGKFLLHSAIRLAENDKAGTIEGKFISETNFTKIVVFAYADDTFQESEMDAQPGSVRFSNAISSNAVNEHNEFTLAFMNEGKYDLYFAMYDENGEFLNLLGSHGDVSVGAQTRVAVDVKARALN